MSAQPLVKPCEATIRNVAVSRSREDERGRLSSVFALEPVAIMASCPDNNDVADFYTDRMSASESSTNEMSPPGL